MGTRRSSVGAAFSFAAAYMHTNIEQSLYVPKTETRGRLKRDLSRLNQNDEKIHEDAETDEEAWL
jgi:hypothetical protein